MDLGEIDLRDEAQRPWTCLVGDILLEELLQVPGQFLPALGRESRPPRPAYSGGEVGHAAHATGPYRRAGALFDRTGFEDNGVARGGGQPRRPLCEAGPCECSFQLFACRPHRIALFTRRKCIDDAVCLPSDGGGHAAECPLLACAVPRRRFPVGARPTRQPLQPEATGAAVEVTKWLKPSECVSRIGDSASVQAV